jgi:hypothetical protein
MYTPLSTPVTPLYVLAKPPFVRQPETMHLTPDGSVTSRVTRFGHVSGTETVSVSFDGAPPGTPNGSPETDWNRPRNLR